MKTQKFPNIERSDLLYWYWCLEYSAPKIAEITNTNENWVTKEIRRHGLEKNKNKVKLRGKKGYKMPWSERLKHHKQPHAKRVFKLDPKTREVVEMYDSMCAASRDGYRKDRIMTAIKTNGTHRGFAFKRDK
ncbi:hypothetical protein BN3087_220030 [Sulfurovum sp. enrichment culture clone C5]|uniref:Uncharacterized protein n=1 Tax=Sulfurovum sp. enrichment culture clone C5 TaxID=497650 RepID=A0A0S4XLU6_9BACT|nr:hypothetical protein BN3087_220030 [Sulfurovum sp. enrichment culture clone C5]